MPPPEVGEALSPRDVDLLRRWIAAGARWERHWSFVPPSRPSLPAVRDGPDAFWPRGAIDRLVLARLEREDLRPSSEAEREALIRRVTIDLTGLPPALDDIDRFLADNSPDAYERLVDRLLQSPAFGERWARVWLDLARYADSAGYAQDPPRVIWRYRDWVIDALNRGLAFDQFTIEQLAGDLLPDPDEEQLIATAFHRNTMTNSEGGTDDEEFRIAAVVDRVNTTMQVWMGLTMECAQCHTHKYDPITQDEYYRFFAVFNSTEDADRGDEQPTIETFTEEQRERRDALEARIASLEADLARAGEATDVTLPVRGGPLETRFIRVEAPGAMRWLHIAEVEVLSGGENVARRGQATQKSDAHDAPARLAIDGNTDGDFFNARSTTHTAQENDPWWEVDLGGAVAVERIVVWNRTDSDGVRERLSSWRLVALDAGRTPVWVASIDEPPRPSAAFDLPPTHEAIDPRRRADTEAYHRERAVDLLPERRAIAELRKEIESIKPVSTPIMRALPAERRRSTHVLIRGNFLDRGTEVSPGVPSAFHELGAGDAPDRLGIARWLVDERNPLTARVLVNRVWEQILGNGLVQTCEDFGRQGALPSHPALLDWLATEVMRTGWDLKALLRLVVTSATYRQTSRVTPELLASDRFNTLLARGPRVRLSAEMVRDQALAVSGLLSTKMRGESVRPPRPKLGLRAAFGGDTDWDPSPGEDRYRRGIYTLWRRTTPYPAMTTFDAPSREFCTVRRITTNTPLQALVTMNDPVHVEAAQALARRVVGEGGAEARSRAIHGFRLVLARRPADSEVDRLVSLAERALVIYRDDSGAAMAMATDPLGPAPAGADLAELAAWTVVANVLLNLDETIMKR